ncbi:Hsp20/alpha crystallin family protein [Massilia sp. P8910]|uniref:Hsp20/alpha crystallin family protein n=1 Tax=Massilia antarctica TaxID=2765360 RepID=UPI001E618EA5|nr:Hsp20/alpha crystallin family protein [Massilia antarctica]MCE3607877.1 Hsp20/alpha crystallin family protein [Massilia antarctica]
MASHLTRFDPVGPLSQMDPFRSFDSLFNAFDLLRPLRAFGSERIRMDVSETDQAFVVRADMPGVKKEDVKVSINGNEVTISADVSQEQEHKEGSSVWRERFQGQQYRSFTLPQQVDEEKASATCRDGVLELTLPKKPGSGGKQLTVQ